MSISSADPIVSIIIPVYNDEKHVADAIESALNQTMKEVEVIVVDDGSTDGTPEVLKRYEGRITIIRQENRGVSAARNAGISASRGKYVCFLDSDDTMMPNKAEVQARALEAHSDAGLCHGIWQKIDIRNGAVLNTYQVWPGILDRESGPFPPFFQLGAAMFRREWVTNIGAFDEALCRAMDTDLHYRLWAAGCRFLSHSDMVLTYRARIGSLSHSRPLQGYLAHLRALEKHFAAMGSAIDEATRNRLRASTWLKIGINHLKAGSRREASDAWARAASCQPDLFLSHRSWITVLNGLDPNHPLPGSDWFPDLKELHGHLIDVLRCGLESKAGLRGSRLRREKAALWLASGIFASRRKKPMLGRAWLVRSFASSPLSLPVRAHWRDLAGVILGPTLSRMAACAVRGARRIRTSPTSDRSG